MAIVTINPATGRELHHYPEHTSREITALAAKAHKTFLAWRQTSFAHRAKLLRSLARELRRKHPKLAALATTEMGKPITQSLAEVEKCALGCLYYAANGAKFLADERPASAPSHRYVTYRPHGVVLSIMPWNFPFWQIYRVAAPALLAGNTVLLKHAANVTGCALAIERTFVRAGFPVGAFQTLVTGSQAIAGLIADPNVATITFTGSTITGKKVATLAGAAMKKCVFELGGSDPYIVLADADLAHAAEVCAAARLYNTGQSCVAGKRFIVVEKVRREFEKLFIDRLATRHTGDPHQATTELGPLAREDLRHQLHAQVKKSVSLGATLLLGGKLPAGPGFYYPTTVLTGVKPGMPACDDELFGPVAAIISAQDEDDAIRIANDSPYGLGAAVFTKNKKRGERIARTQLDSGCAFVNEFVRSHPALPFGGTKQSGYGRELGAWGIREFAYVKTISVS
jgi:succinate-semialdehyde dehydrogenase / glutarate-semialdehyde dehydrogenase